MILIVTLASRLNEKLKFKISEIGLGYTITLFKILSFGAGAFGSDMILDVPNNFSFEGLNGIKFSRELVFSSEGLLILVSVILVENLDWGFKVSAPIPCGELYA